MTRTFISTALLTATAICAAGCAGQTAARQPGQVIYLQETEYARAFEAGLEAVQEYFAIEKQDRDTGEILAKPILFSSAGPGERLSAGLTGAKDALRRRALVLVMKRELGSAIDVRVNIERQDTEDYRIYEGIQASEDLRMRTPAELMVTADPEQREVWTFLRRDYQLEEQIIRGIKERLGLLQPTGSTWGTGTP